jgi:hypothetical protein
MQFNYVVGHVPWFRDYYRSMTRCPSFQPGRTKYVREGALSASRLEVRYLSFPPLGLPQCRYLISFASHWQNNGLMPPSVVSRAAEHCKAGDVFRHLDDTLVSLLGQLRSVLAAREGVARGCGCEKCAQPDAVRPVLDQIGAVVFDCMSWSCCP